MYERLLQQLINICRIGSDEFLPFALQLIAWLRISKHGQLQRELAFNPDNAPRDAKHIALIFHKIGESQSLGINNSAFSYVSPIIQHLSSGQLLQSLELISSSNLEEPWPEDNLIRTIGPRLGRGIIDLPQELIDLMISLAEIQSDERVYIPFEQSFQLTGFVHQVSHLTYSETPLAGPFPWLINLLADLDSHIYVGDSLEKPGFLDEGRLSKFDVSIAFPPFGVRYDASLTELDRFGRFPEHTSAIAVLAVRHLLARTNGRIVVAVPNSLLFSPGAERSLREDLLNKRKIEAVIALPAALLAGTAIQFSILVLRQDSPCEKIIFVDGCNETLYIKDGKGRATLSGWQPIAEAALKCITGPISRAVLASEVLKNDSQLQVSRYCKTSDDEAVDLLLKRFPTKALGELVTFVRPIPPSPQDGTVQAFEVGPADFPAYGYAMNPGREVKLSEINLARGVKQFLRPLDIAVAIKGSIGKVAIFPPKIPEETHDKWIVGQSCIVLRVNDKDIIDPRVIFSFFKSEAGQIQLKKIVSEASVPLIQLRELEKITIPVPDRVIQEEVIRAFEKTVEIEHAIANFRDEQHRLNSAIWKI
jgi:type I restriction enzyme M protein